MSNKNFHIKLVMYFSPSIKFFIYNEFAAHLQLLYKNRNDV